MDYRDFWCKHDGETKDILRRPKSKNQILFKENNRPRIDRQRPTTVADDARQYSAPLDNEVIRKVKTSTDFSSLILPI